MNRFADLVEQHTEELAALDGADAGKLLLLGKIIDIPSAVQMLRYYAGAADKIHGETLRVSGKYQGYTLREPIGVVGVIIPWNFPTMMFFLKVSPPLAARRMHRRGQARRSDPALRAPRQAGAGVPNGVINFVPGFVETARISSGFTALVHVWCALVAH
jgi:coniferyl-aldehyde dehydrogenase